MVWGRITCSIHPVYKKQHSVDTPRAKFKIAKIAFASFPQRLEKLGKQQAGY
jgi:hypothetical protein